MKEKLEVELVALAKKIAALNDYPALSQNAKLEVRLNAHSAQWRALIYQAFAKVYEYAKLLNYSSNAYSNYEITGDDKEGEVNFSRKDQLLTEASEEIIKVATRRFSSDELTKGDAYIEENFIKKLTVDLQLSVLNASNKERVEKIHQGITGFSEKNQRLVKEYNKFKQNILRFKNKSITEDEVMELFLKTNLPNEWEKNPQKAKDKLNEKLKMFLQTNVIGETYIESLSVKKFEDYPDERNVDPEVLYLRKEEQKEKLKQFNEKIEAAEEFFAPFEKRENSDLNYWKAIITQYLLEEMQAKKQDSEILNKLRKCNFAHEGLIHELELTGSFSSRSDILKQMNKDKGQASRNIKAFKEFIKNYKRKVVK